ALRRGPLLAVITDGVAIPHLALASRQRMLPIEQPHSSRIIDHQPRHALIATLLVCTEGVRRLHELAVYQTFDSDGSVDIQVASRVLIERGFLDLSGGIVLAPLFVAGFVCDPDAVFGITSKAGSRFETRRVGGGESLRVLADDVKADVVIALVVSVP